MLRGGEMLSRWMSVSLYSNEMKKTLREIFTKTWQIKSAKEKMEASKASRNDTVKTHLTSDFVERCSGKWLQCSKDVLLVHAIDTF